MDDDWASDTDKDYAEFAVPEVEVALPEPPPTPDPPAPVVNAWTSSNQSGDIRSAARLRQPPPSTRRPLDLRDPRTSPRNVPPASSAPSPRMNAPSPRAAPGFAPLQGRGGGGGEEIALYVSNLPLDVDERGVATIFQQAFVPPSDVRFTRGDAGKCAYISVRSEANRDVALGLNGVEVRGNALQVSVDRRGPPGRGGAGDRERGGYGFGRERRKEGGATPGRETGWSSGGWVDRGGGGGGGFEQDLRSDGRGNGRGGWGEGGSSGRGGRDGRRDGDREQRPDPSIPTGPTPAGRKKLQLKPRTKPPPVLEIDKRAIDGVHGGGAAVSSAASVVGEVRERERSAMGGGGGRGFGGVGMGGGGGLGSSAGGAGGGGMGVRNGAFGWKEGGERTKNGTERMGNGAERMRGGGDRSERGSTAYMNPDVKREEEARRPKLLNAFAALEVGEEEE